MTEPKPSGLKNPAAAVRGLGAATLGFEVIVLLLMLAPLKKLAGDQSGPPMIAVLMLTVIAAVLTGMMKRDWAWTAGTVLQVALLLGGFLHWTLAAVGVIFGLAWVYALHVRRSILG
ncbi:DUF4233 domain-containing protein [Actinoplanes sp. G11-F43]|uniref:DUF4233 domain-containing protein n=1 Tax=Actinoplanes sp. G11-F43 TaxID=3424130 RepID=UPI003D333CBD